MIVKCENERCGATYNLDLSHVRKGSVRVRCSICKHEFSVSPFPHADAEGLADASMSDPDMKAIGKWVGLGVAVIAVAVIIVAVFLGR